MMFSVTAFEAGSVHWASDAVAATLMTYPIARSVGSGFRRIVHGGEVEDRTISVLPVVTRHGTFLTVGGHL
jgi:hypothetical protein